ncbi:MAG: D-ribose pyranase [Bacillota bacterium]|uniref:D-ribose pyranase n=1 Tax=Symbiobacterium thermophilum TaxID=2734 RepID=A0A1Y2T7V6_SYMTR|nr:MAG: D-ribose pyranase [Symbiobacterium thermophilum]PZN73110.1 MAG: D-ribose pyranase [Bacillota bacterium]
MKKTTLLNQALSEVVAGMGHGDLLVIGDYGLPCPQGVRRIDLALRPGIPAFLDVVETVLTELQVEAAVIARETAERNPAVQEGLNRLLGGIPITTVSHEELKQMSARAVALVRTGECTPYANVILRAGVTF